MRRRRTNNSKPREKRTLIPTFDPGALAKEIEQEVNRTTLAPPFDPSCYARIVEERSLSGDRDTPGTTAAAGRAATDLGTPPGAATGMATAPCGPDPDPNLPMNSSGGILPPPPSPESVTPLAPPAAAVDSEDATVDLDNPETIGREMYGCYLASDFPEALVLAERLLEREPAHTLAQLVAQQCRERLYPTPATPTLRPSSVLRLKAGEFARHADHIDATSSFVLGHVDGISDAATVAALTGLPGAEALNRLHALLDLGVLEVVSL